jgi:hypothetical protein
MHTAALTRQHNIATSVFRLGTLFLRTPMQEIGVTMFKQLNLSLPAFQQDKLYSYVSMGIYYLKKTL